MAITDPIPIAGYPRQVHSEIKFRQAAQNTLLADINTVRRISMKRIRFTKQELGLIIEMGCIAESGPPEGDYQDWDREGKYELLESLTDKVYALRRR
jgi:hypothetical protein